MSLSQPGGGGARQSLPDLTPRSRARSRTRIAGLLFLGAVLATGAGTAMLATNGGLPGPTSPATASGTAAAILPTDAPTMPPGSLAPTAGATPGPSATQTPSAAPSPAATPEPKEPAPTSAPPEELTGYVWPLRDARITSRFGPRDFGGFVVDDGREIHDGLDLATFCGNKLRAAHSGTVLYAGRKFDDYLGYLGSANGVYQRLERQGRLNTLPIVVVIDDGNGYRSVYVHLSKATVEAGQEVEAGEVIGQEGATGYATGCHLHYTLIRMDGPWQPVVTSLHPYGYPPFVRQRVNPMLVLPHDHPDAPARLREKFESPSPDPSPPASLSPAPSATSTARPSASTAPTASP